MAGVTKEQRHQSWNIHILVGTRCVAGFYQRDDLLRVSDLAHELELCLVFDKPHNETLWRPALLASDSTYHGLTVLDYQDNLPFPTPEDIREYTYVFHSSECTIRNLHPLEGNCHVISLVGFLL